MGHNARRVVRWGCLLLVFIVVVVGLVAAVLFSGRSRSNSTEVIGRWFNEPASRAGLITQMVGAACPEAPFILPSDGFIGLLWSDPVGPYTIFNPHSGIDIFGNGEPGKVAVYAAYDGWLTRRADWLSSVIIRHDDPLQPGRTIWTYYTHMADRDGLQSFIVTDFPPGIVDEPIRQGALLGYQGEYAGEGAAPIGLHVHFSIVLSEADGSFMNEAHIGNTLDPSPYIGMALNIGDLPLRPIGCELAE
jgi:hypothetical protein